MSAAPAMPLFPDSYLADTTHLSTEEHGAYLLLLMAMWRRNGTVPNDDKDLARIVGLSPRRWVAIKARLMPFLNCEDGLLSQKRLQKEWVFVQEKRTKNAQNGALGGRPAYNKNNDIDKANGSVPHNPNETPSTHTQSSKEKEEPSGSSKKRGTRIPDDFEPSLAEALKAGLDMNEFGIERLQFLDYWRSKAGAGSTKNDWEATWRVWCRNAVKRRRQQPRAGPNGKRMNAVEANNSLRNRGHEPSSAGYDFGDAELLPPDKPGLPSPVADLGKALSWNERQSNH